MRVTPNTMPRMVAFTSDFDLDHAEDHGHADDGGCGGSGQPGVAPAVIEGLEVAGVDDLYCEQNEDGQDAQDESRESAFSREHLHLSSNLLPRSDEIGQGMEQVGQPASHGLLDADGLYDPRQVPDLEAGSHPLEA